MTTLVAVTVVYSALISCNPERKVAAVWDLPSGYRAEFYHASSGFFQSDHEKCMDIVKSDSTRMHWEFAQSHSGYNNVEMRISDDGATIWIVDLDQKQIGMSLNLVSFEFKNENEAHPIGVSLTNGRKLLERP